MYSETKMTTCSTTSIVKLLLWAENWGHLVCGRNRGGHHHHHHLRDDEDDGTGTSNPTTIWWYTICRSIAILAIPTVCICQLIFYKMLNSDTSWAAFASFILLDGSVTIIGMVIIILGPVGKAAATTNSPSHLSPNSRCGNGTEIDIVPPETQPLLITPSSSSTSPRQDHQHRNTGTIVFSHVTSHDVVIQLLFVISVCCALASVASDHISTIHDVNSIEQPDSVSSKVLWWCGFVSFDVMNDILYCSGFLFLSVSYRILALRVWKIRDELLELYHHQQHHDHESSQQEQQQRQQQEQHQKELMSFIRTARRRYEDAYEASEQVSDSTGLVTLLLIALTALEMASTLSDVFEDKENFEFESMSVAEWAMVRLLVVLAAVILQVAWTAADMYFASEKLGEVVSQFETQVLCQQSTFEPQLPSTLKAFGYRCHTYPVRIEVAWFHLTTEWAMGLSLLVATLLLAVFGLKVPAGE